jgi:ubiquinone/menaquinone biosynthesis C-methylase UbiE
MKLTLGMRVLDIGCGPATDTITFARAVGPQGNVEGIDHDPEMIATANERGRAAGVADWTRHEQGDAEQLPFPDESFDVVHVERVFMHLPEPERALQEIVRVTRQGGRIVIGEPDWATLSVACSDIDLERRMVRFWASSLKNGYFARTLKGLCLQAGLAGSSPKRSVLCLLG